MLWVAAMYLLLSMADMVCLVCRNCGVHEQCWVGMVCWSLSYVVKFAAEHQWHIGLSSMTVHVEGCRVSSAEYHVHLVGPGPRV